MSALRDEWPEDDDDPLSWKIFGECRHYPLELFFPVVLYYRNTKRRHTNWEPVEDKSATLRNYALARRICASCPVKDECLRWSIANQSDGLAGGLSARQRRELRRRLHLPEPE
jgi:WhiB family transcriptional regulator, redox-sensing transcriptional regulator